MLSLSSMCADCYPLDRRCEGIWPVHTSREVGTKDGGYRQHLITRPLAVGGDPWGGVCIRLLLVAGPLAVTVTLRKVVEMPSSLGSSSNVYMFLGSGSNRQHFVAGPSMVATPE